MEEIAIKVENLGKKYLIGHQKSGSISDRVRNIFSPKNKEVEEFWALKEVNFEIKRGEAVGIIGKNGAGKSTLLKILSRITEPSAGRVEINGRVSSLLEVGTGFHPELSGRENIYLNGTILGMTRKEVKAKFDEIVAFSDVEKFLDTPVKHYSSGMYVRLAFSVAAHLEPEILIIDEVLAVGDAEFQKKCLGKMGEVTGEGRTVLFVSHNMAALRNLCPRSIHLTNGRKSRDGETGYVIDKYLHEDNIKNGKNLIDIDQIKWEDDSYVQIDEVSVEDRIGEKILVPKSDEEFVVSIHFETKQEIYGLRFMLFLKDFKDSVIFSYSSEEQTRNLKSCKKYEIKFKFNKNLFLSAKYKIQLSIGIPGKLKILDRTTLFWFEIKNSGIENNKYDGNNEGLILPQLRSELLELT